MPFPRGTVRSLPPTRRRHGRLRRVRCQAPRAAGAAQIPPFKGQVRAARRLRRGRRDGGRCLPAGTAWKKPACKAGKLQLLGVYSDPERDPRGHTCTVVFLTRVRSAIAQGRRRCRRRRMGGRLVRRSISPSIMPRSWQMPSARCARNDNRERHMADFDGKVILVTGSATGLGAAIAIGAAKRGAKAVILNCTQEPEGGGGDRRRRAGCRRRSRDRPGRRGGGRRLPQDRRRCCALRPASTRWSTTPASPSRRRTTPTSTRCRRTISCVSMR